MNLQFYIEKLESSEVFQNFKKKNKQAYLASAFFTIDIVNNSTKIQLDYFNKDNFAVFLLNEEIQLKQEDAAKTNKPEKLGSSQLDISKLPEITEKILTKNNISEKLTKIIAILTQQSKPVFSLSCITSFMSVIKIKLDDSGKCLSFEKLNLFDFVKKQ